MNDPDITQILADSDDAGLSRESADRVFAAAYDELKAMAANRMRGEPVDHTLQPTALLNEAYVRLVDPTRIGWRNRSQFFAVAARAMRQVLVDHARRRRAAKRGGGWERVLLDDVSGGFGGGEIELIDLDEAFEKLSARHERMARVAELRVLAGLTGREIADVLGVSRKTVVEDWRFASMWLRAELGGDDAP